MEQQKQVRIRQNKVLQILTPKDSKQLEIWKGKSKYSVKSIVYDEVRRIKGCILVRNGNKYGLLSNFAEVIFPLEFDSIDIYSKGFVVEKQQVKTLYLSDGQIFEKYQYGDTVEKFFDNCGTVLYYSSTAVHRVTLLSLSRDLLVRCDGYIDLGDKLILNDDRGKGYIYFIKTGKLLKISLEFHHKAMGFYDMIYYYIADNKGVIIGKDGKFVEIVDALKYSAIDVNKVTIHQKIYFIVERKKAVATNLNTFDVVIGVSQVSSEKGVIGENGKLLLSYGCRDITCEDDFFLVRKKGKVGLYSPYDGWVLSCKYDLIRQYVYLSEALYVVCNHKVGLALKSGRDKFIVPVKYNDIRFDKSYFIVKEGINYGLYDINGNLLLPVRYSEICVMRNTAVSHPDRYYFRVKVGSAFGVFDINGQAILEPEYDYVEKIFDSFIVRKLNRYGLVSNVGERLLSPLFDDINISPDGRYCIIRKKGKQGLYSIAERKLLISIGLYKRLMIEDNKVYAIEKLIDLV